MKPEAATTKTSRAPRTSQKKAHPRRNPKPPRKLRRPSPRPHLKPSQKTMRRERMRRSLRLMRERRRAVDRRVRELRVRRRRSRDRESGLVRGRRERRLMIRVLRRGRSGRALVARRALLRRRRSEVCDVWLVAWLDGGDEGVSRNAQIVLCRVAPYQYFVSATRCGSLGLCSVWALAVFCKSIVVVAV